jgi:hypothetical protein
MERERKRSQLYLRGRSSYLRTGGVSRRMMGVREDRGTKMMIYYFTRISDDRGDERRNNVSRDAYLVEDSAEHRSNGSSRADQETVDFAILDAKVANVLRDTWQVMISLLFINFRNLLFV